MPKVVVVGDTDADLYYIVDHIPTWDEGVLVDKFLYCPGGKGANTAAAISKLGEDVGILSVVGDDEYGRKAVAELRKNHVDLGGMEISKEFETYHCITILDPSGEKALLVRTTEIVYPLPEQFEKMKSYLCSAKHAHFIALNPDRMIPAVKMAKQAGVCVSIDLDAAYPGLDKCSEIIQNSDIVIVNCQGAESFFPDMNIRERIQRLLEMGPSTAIITMGSKGVAAGNKFEFVEKDAYHVEVVDTSGSGDTFSAAICYCSINGMNLEDSLQFASAAAAYSIRAIGAQSALPSKEDVLSFINQNKR